LPQNPDDLLFRKTLFLHLESPRVQEILTFPPLQFSGSRSAAKTWLERLEALSPEDTQEIFDRLPKSEITSIAIEFAQRMLILNRERLLDLKRNLS
jgi:hypothetical protein